MKNSELIEYLKRYDDDANIGMIIADLKKREKYEFDVHLLTDAEIPVFAIELIESGPFTAEEVEAAEECESEGLCQ